MGLILNELDVVLEGLRKFLVGFAVRDGGLPTGQGSIDRFDFHIGGGGHPVSEFAVDTVGGADLDFIEFVKDVGLGERDVGDAVDHQCVLECDKVKPSATSWSSGGCAILIAFLAEKFSRFVEEFCREGSAAHAGAVCLHDTEDAAGVMRG